jgi:hypothetical protein
MERVQVRPWLVLLVFVVAPAVARPADPAPTIEDVKKAWKTRQDAHKSFRVEWVETVTVKAGAYGKPDGPHPPEDKTFRAAGSFAADGDKAAATEERLIYGTTEKTWQPYMRASRFDGRTFMVLAPLDRPGWGHARIESGTPVLGLGLIPSTSDPIQDLYRPLGGGAFPALEFEKFKLADGRETIRKTECIEVTLKEPKPPAGHSLWCDPERGFLPIRAKRRGSGGDGYDVDWTYRKNEAGRWVPSGWEFRRVGRDGATATAVKAEVKKLEFDLSFAADAFAPKPPPSSRVTVSEGSAVKEDYLVRLDGSKRPLKRAEYDKDFTELAKTNADGTPYVPAKK